MKTGHINVMISHTSLLYSCLQRILRGRGWLVLLLLFVVGCGETAVSPHPTFSPTPTAGDSRRLPPTEQPEKKWEAAIGDGLSAPAVLAGGWVIVATETAVIAHDPETGVEQWRVSPPEGVWPRSIAANSATVVVGIGGHVLALNAVDGAEMWRQPVQGELLWPPLIADAHVFAGTAFVGPGVEPDANGQAWVYAFDAVSGKEQWSQETAAYTLVTPAVNDDMVIVGGSLLNETDVEEGGHLRIHAFDKINGTVRWMFDSLDGFLKSLATDGERVYFLAYTDMLYGLDGKTGTEVWRYPTENWSPGFAFDAGMIFMGSDNAFVHAIEGVSGTAVWRVPLTGVFNAPRARPAVLDEFLYFQSNDNQLYCLNRQTGEVCWSTDPQPRSRVALTIGYRHLFLVDQNGVLIGFGN